VAIGDLRLHRFFDGDVARLRARGDEDTSLRRLAEHPDLPFSASTLSRQVSVFEVVQRIGGLDAVKSLTHHPITPFPLLRLTSLGDSAFVGAIRVSGRDGVGCLAGGGQGHRSGHAWTR
jgi:hypothetical protein